ncbi:hypothetical protein TrLO_g9897 [Triparma laevis f. longispina]|uniref:Uncharacterized protein n=1 Tax=Triparma laevis f. longispina TaxID=1714387 RepID=A0A9W7FDX7_9STRA|nr:hypothetical protein TrLO_g9897 [Triparma laevis f. longispina]
MPISGASGSLKDGSNETHETGHKSSTDEEESEDQAGTQTKGIGLLLASTTVSAAPVAADQFMHTPEFRRHFVEFLPVDELMALRLATKGWNAAADALIDEVFASASGAMMVHDGKDTS